MKIFKKIVLLAFIGSVFVTCKKEELPQSTTIGQPIFYFSGTIGNNTESWQAGTSNYYMFSSDTQSVAGVYSFIGNLKSTATVNNSIEIIINDNQVSATNASLSLAHIDTSLSTARLYGFNKGPGVNDTSYSVTFIPKIYSGAASTFTYSFGDLTPNAVTNNNTPIPHTYKTRNTYNTSLTVNFSSCGSLSMSNPFYVDSNALIIDSITSYITHNPLRDSLKATVKGGNSPYTYKWYAPGSVQDTSESAYPIFTYSSSGIDTIRLVVIDAGNHTATYKYCNVVDDTAPPCRFDYTMSPPVIHITTTNSNALSDVVILYTNNSGVQYTSKNASQPSGSTFIITSVSAYQNNLFNNPTEMLKVTFNCMLYPVNNASLQPIQATNCTAVIAVAY